MRAKLVASLLQHPKPESWQQGASRRCGKHWWHQGFQNLAPGGPVAPKVCRLAVQTTPSRQDRLPRTAKQLLPDHSGAFAVSETKTCQGDVCENARPQFASWRVYSSRSLYVIQSAERENAPGALLGRQRIDRRLGCRDRGGCI